MIAMLFSLVAMMAYSATALPSAANNVPGSGVLNQVPSVQNNVRQFAPVSAKFGSVQGPRSKTPSLHKPVKLHFTGKQQGLPSTMPVSSAGSKSFTIRAGSKYELVADKAEVNRIKYLAEVTSLSYNEKKRESIKTMDIISVVQEGRYLALIAIDKSTNDLIITFGGMSHWSDVEYYQNWKIDLINWEFPFSKFDGVRVHKGFSQIWKSLQFHVYEVLRSEKVQNHMHLLYPKSKVTMTGHCTGGGVAAIAAMDLVNRQILDASSIELVTFGAPKIGNAAFAESMNTMSFRSLIRVINRDDIVPYFPSPEFGYRHYGGLRHIVGNKMLINHSTNELPIGFDPVSAVRCHWGLFDKYNVFHRSNNYLISQ